MTKLHEINVIRISSSPLHFEQDNSSLKGEFSGYSLSTSRVPGKRMWYKSIEDAKNTAVSIDKCDEAINDKQELDTSKNQYKIEEMHVLYVKTSNIVHGYLQDNQDLKKLTSVVYTGQSKYFV
jgi:hypothetical protein